MHSRSAIALLAGLGCLLAAGCGAGLITAAAAGNNNSTPPPAATPPELSLPESRIPLMPTDQPAQTSRTVVVTNALLPASARLRVVIRAVGVTADQDSPAILSEQGQSTVVGFSLHMQPLVDAIGDPTVRDVDGQLAVLVDDVEVAPAVPVLLLRQPVATLVTAPGEDHVLLSPVGGTRVQLRLSGLRAETTAELQMLVTTADPSGQTTGITRACANLSLATDSSGALVAADVPANTFPGQATFVVQDGIAGRSTAVADAYYRPDVALALPAQGPTTGGTLVTLIGSALAPLDFSVQPAVPRFDRVQLLFRKGGREVGLAATDLRAAESALDRLVFTMPTSPDGRPGRVGIVLRVDLGAVTVEVIAPDRFLFANPRPVFGPRGAVLDRLPVAVTPIALESAPDGTDAPDFALLFDEGGVGSLQLLMAQENGMFIRFGQPRRIGDPEAPAERGPRDLCAADFDGDRVPDLLSINAGAAVAKADLVLGQPKPLPPLGAESGLATDGAGGRSVAVDLDGDGKRDLVILPAHDAPPSQLPGVYLSRAAGVGAPSFVRIADLPVRAGPYDAIEIADLDGDGIADVAVLSGGLQMHLDIAFGNGDGTFVAPTQAIDLAVPGYTPDAAAAAVGVHACGSGPQLALAVVLAGLESVSATPPVVAVLQQPTPRTFAQPVPADVLVVGSGSVGTSLAADLRGDGTVDLVLGAASTPSIGVLAWTGSNFQSSQLLLDPELLNIHSLHFGTAFPPDPLSGARGASAVYVVHESTIDGVRETRLSTLLAIAQPALLPPSAGGSINRGVSGIAGGDFLAPATLSSRSPRDIALATDQDLRLLVNDGFGGFFSVGPDLVLGGIVPATLALAQITAAAPRGDALAVCTVDGHVVVWQPQEVAPQVVSVTDDLRLLAPAGPLRTAAVASSSRLRSADVDGDGIQDLVVLLTFDLPSPGEGDGLLVVLRGRPSFAAGELPYLAPTVATPVHGRAADFALGDFAPDGSTAPVMLELALTVPAAGVAGGSDGNDVRFYRYDAGASLGAQRFVRSVVSGGPQVLLAGNAPTLVAAADFDHNGTVDLLVAVGGDATLRLFLNDGTPAPMAGEVNLNAFHESLASPLPLSPGRPLSLLLGDINGDGAVDALCVTESTVGPTLSTSVAFYLNSGTGVFADPSFVSPTRLGSGIGALVLDLGDYNGDGVPDLAVGLNTTNPSERNVRVLFGGSR